MPPASIEASSLRIYIYIYTHTISQHQKNIDVVLLFVYISHWFHSTELQQQIQFSRSVLPQHVRTTTTMTTTPITLIASCAKGFHCYIYCFLCLPFYVVLHWISTPYIRVLETTKLNQILLWNNDLHHQLQCSLFTGEICDFFSNNLHRIRAATQLNDF